MRLLFPIFLIVSILAKDAVLLYSYHTDEQFLMECPIETSSEEGESEQLEIDDQIYDEFISHVNKMLIVNPQLENYASAFKWYNVPTLDIFSPPPELLS